VAVNCCARAGETKPASRTTLRATNEQADDLLSTISSSDRLAERLVVQSATGAYSTRAAAPRV